MDARPVAVAAAASVPLGTRGWSRLANNGCFDHRALVTGHVIASTIPTP